MGHRGPPGGKKKIFSKNGPAPREMPKQAGLTRFEPVVARFCPSKAPKCLENRLFLDRKWVKNGSQHIFQELITDYLGYTNR